MAEPANRIHVEFFMGTQEDKFKSTREGRPIFKDVEMVRIRWVGDNKREHIAPAHDGSVRDPQDNTRWLSYADRFPAHYKAFKENVQFQGEGTPIEEAPFLTNAQRAEMKAINIHTVEGLADPTSHAITKLGMGGRRYVEQAAAYLEQAKGVAPMSRLAAENAALRDEMEALRNSMEAFMSAAKPVAAPGAEPVEAEDESKSDIFDKWDDEALKAFIKERTGALPRGNPSHTTLVRMADEANTKVAA